MQFTQKLDYVRDSDTVIKMFGDKDYFVRKFELLNARSFEVLEHELDGDKFRIKMKAELPMSAPVPGFAKKFVGDTVTLVETDSWNLATKTGSIEVDVKGAPVDASGIMTLTDGGKGAVNSIDWTVKCSVPLIGKKLEKLIADDINAKGADDERISNEIVADYG